MIDSHINQGADGKREKLRKSRGRENALLGDFITFIPRR